MRWRIYYGDGSTYGDGDAFAAPSQNVQLIANSDPDHGWYLCRATDYYWYLPEEDRWYCGDIFGLFDYLLQPGPRKVLFGRSIPSKEFNALVERAHNDPEIPQKTGWQPYEHRPKS